MCFAFRYLMTDEKLKQFLELVDKNLSELRAIMALSYGKRVPIFSKQPDDEFYRHKIDETLSEFITGGKQPDQFTEFQVLKNLFMLRVSRGIDSAGSEAGHTKVNKESGSEESDARQGERKGEDTGGTILNNLGIVGVQETEPVREFTVRRRFNVNPEKEADNIDSAEHIPKPIEKSKKYRDRHIAAELPDDILPKSEEAPHSDGTCDDVTYEKCSAKDKTGCGVISEKDEAKVDSAEHIPKLVEKKEQEKNTEAAATLMNQGEAPHSDGTCDDVTYEKCSGKDHNQCIRCTDMSRFKDKSVLSVWGKKKRNK